MVYRKRTSRSHINFTLLREIKSRGWSQRDFAKAVGDYEAAVSRIVNGTWKADDERKERYAEVLGVSVEEIFNEDVQ